MTSNAACAKRIYYRGGKAGLLCWRIHLTGGRNGLHQTRSSAEGCVRREYDEDVYDMNLVYTTT